LTGIAHFGEITATVPQIVATVEPQAHFRDFLGSRRITGDLPRAGERFRLTHSGRGAIYQVLRALPGGVGNTVLVPSFHCPTVVDPVVHSGYRPVYYRIRRDLSIDIADLSRKLGSDVAAVVVINFFGFPADLEALLAVRARHRFLLIEDCAHSFLATDPLRLAGGRGDVDIYSFRKLVAMGTGGGARSNLEGLRLPPSRSLVSWKHVLMLSKRLAEQAIENSSWSLVGRAYGFLERTRVSLKRRPAPPTPGARAKIIYTFEAQLDAAAMPSVSRWILARSDLSRIVRLRQRNYRRLATRIKPTAMSRPLFPVLPPQTCPWAFPLLIPGRERFDLQLRGLGVPVFTFGETLMESVFEAEPELVDDARYLSTSLLLVPIHQDLEEHRMDEFAHTINTFFMSAAQRPASVILDARD